MSGLGEAWAADQKSLVDCQQSAKYWRQLPLRLCGQHALQLLPRTDRYGPNILHSIILGKFGSPNMNEKKKNINKLQTWYKHWSYLKTKIVASHIQSFLIWSIFLEHEISQILIWIIIAHLCSSLSWWKSYFCGLVKRQVAQMTWQQITSQWK